MRPKISKTRWRIRIRVAEPAVFGPRGVDQLRELVRLAEQAQGAGQREVAASLIGRAYLLHDGRLAQATH